MWGAQRCLCPVRTVGSLSRRSGRATRPCLSACVTGTSLVTALGGQRGVWPHGPHGSPLPTLLPPLTLLVDVIVLLGVLGFVVGDAPDDCGLGGRPAPQVDLPVQGPQRLHHLGRRQGPSLPELDGVDLLGHGLLLQEPLLVPLLRGDTSGGAVTGQRHVLAAREVLCALHT